MKLRTLASAAALAAALTVPALSAPAHAAPTQAAGQSCFTIPWPPFVKVELTFPTGGSWQLVPVTKTFCR